MTKKYTHTRKAMMINVARQAMQIFLAIGRIGFRSRNITSGATMKIDDPKM
eukprot:CAMPEP_0170554816 /NCGR_PEP_ID=MMETSP0211-20121228/12692_1 /TAXON_ID=311385 /ORGANISM="Pseudokeronopsis sp., Strain OXSARD2" /LENGTH=50 /DNA_ID=CAMNT_0010864183 /DNA_START=421 /DNA_END=573 /DNA_ORIENTATION=-